MMKKNKLKLWKAVIAPCLLFSLFLTCCEDETKEVKTIVPYNPSKPIIIDRFLPDSGRVATQMFIWGENFGGNKDSISVFINDKKAAVIGVNPSGTLLYCIVPSLRGDEIRKDGDELKAPIKVVVANKESNVPDKQLVYTFSQNVSTFLGFTDQDGNSDIIDGEFEKAQFKSPFWLAFDTDINGQSGPDGKPKKNIYLIEENVGLRFIDLYNKNVSTVFSVGNGVNRPRTIAFTLSNDTMIIANDGDEWDWIGTIIIPRDTVSRRFMSPWRAVMHHKQCNGGAVHPATGDYWFNSYSKSQVYKVFERSGEIWRYGGPTADRLNEDGKEGTNCFFYVQDDNWEFNIQIAPSGKFAYIVSKNQHYIASMQYSLEKGAFEKPGPFAGARQKSGFQDGVTGNALFNEPQQGAFDKNDNFYVCDGENNCIRMVTPEGQVSTFAGRPGNPGYSDGALRDAQFDGPFGIIYDDDIETFYIADRDNFRIRSIKVE